MPRLQRKSFSTPDEVRTFPSGRVEIIHLDEIAIGPDETATGLALVKRRRGSCVYTLLPEPTHRLRDVRHARSNYG